MAAEVLLTLPHLAMGLCLCVETFWGSVASKPSRCCHTWPHPSIPILSPVSLQPVGAGCRVFEGRPKLAAWHQRVEAAVGEVLFQEAHEVILKAKDSQAADPTIKRKLMPRVLSMIQ